MTAASSSWADTRPRYQRIAASAGNANHWYVVSVANRGVGPLTGVGLLPFVLVVAALLLIAALVWRCGAGRRRLSRPRTPMR